MAGMQVHHLLGLERPAHLHEMLHGVPDRRSFLAVELAFVGIAKPHELASP